MPPMRSRLATLLLLSLPVLLAGCPTQDPYAACALDEEVTKKQVCDGSGEGGGSTGTTSCVVTAHPHCTSSVCISFFNRRSVCTNVCKTDADCDLGGVCWAFSDTNSFCVPKDQFCSVNKTSSACQ